jgi:hypothetical protein
VTVWAWTRLVAEPDRERLWEESCADARTAVQRAGPVLKATGAWRARVAYGGDELVVELRMQEPPALRYAWSLTEATARISSEAPTVLRALRDAGLYGRLHALGHRPD